MAWNVIHPLAQIVVYSVVFTAIMPVTLPGVPGRLGYAVYLCAGFFPWLAFSDGIVRGWFDGRIVIEHTNVVLRSPDFPKMKFNQFLMAPYFGPGLLPHAQRLWIDELAVGTKRIGPLAANPSPSARQGATRVRGLAAAYPGDVEIEQDPAVVFVDSFEGTEFRQWNNAEPPRAPKVELVTEKARVHVGKQAVQFTVPHGKGVGAGLVKWFKPGYDQLYARWYFAHGHIDMLVTHPPQDVLVCRHLLLPGEGWVFIHKTSEGGADLCGLGLALW